MEQSPSGGGVAPAAPAPPPAAAAAPPPAAAAAPPPAAAAAPAAAAPAAAAAAGAAPGAFAGPAPGKRASRQQPPPPLRSPEHGPRDSPPVVPELRDSLEDSTGRPRRRRETFIDGETGQEEEAVCATDFECLRLLGKGDVGKVFLVRHKETQRCYAMKVMCKQDILRRKKVNRLMTEWEVLTRHDHPMVARLYWCFQSRTKLYFVLEYCAGGEFFRFLQRQQNCRVPEHVARFYAAEVLLALEFLHVNGFVYRDIKPENILMDAEGHVLLTDFDLAKRADGAVSVAGAKDKLSGSVCTSPAKHGFSSFVGTAEYIAPEIIRDSGYNLAVDWWGFGILIYEMIFGTTPFRGQDQTQTFSNISTKEVKFPAQPLISDACRSLIKALLHNRPEQRLGTKSGAAEIKAHKWFKEVNFSLVRNSPAPIRPTVVDPSCAPPYQGENPLSDGELDDSFCSTISAAEGTTSAAPAQSPYNHPAYKTTDPFARFKYYRYRGHGQDGVRRYQRQVSSPVSPTTGRCTGYGPGSCTTASPTFLQALRKSSQSSVNSARSGTADVPPALQPTFCSVSQASAAGVDVDISVDFGGDASSPAVMLSPSARCRSGHQAPPGQPSDGAKPPARRDGCGLRCFSPRGQESSDAAADGHPAERSLTSPSAKSPGTLEKLRQKLRRSSVLSSGRSQTVAAGGAVEREPAAAAHSDPLRS